MYKNQAQNNDLKLNGQFDLQLRLCLMCLYQMGRFQGDAPKQCVLLAGPESVSPFIDLLCLAKDFSDIVSVITLTHCSW